MKLTLHSSIPFSLLAMALGCGGAGGTGPEPSVAGADERSEVGAGPAEQPDAPAAEHTGSAAQPSASEPPPPSSVPTSEGDCMEFHLKMIECGRSAGGVDPTEEARMRASAESGCRAALDDRENPVTAFVLRLWARCKDLPCAEAEACVRSGMAELSAPPGPYSPSPR